MNIQTIFDQDWASEFQQRLAADGPWANWEMYRLAAQIQKVTAIDSFEGLQAPAHLPAFTPLKHQLEVARRVVEEMNGKAILADEVGLGKTVEAGLIIKEYMIRGLAKKFSYSSPPLSYLNGYRSCGQNFILMLSNKKELRMGAV